MSTLSEIISRVVQTLGEGTPVSLTRAKNKDRRLALQGMREDGGKGKGAREAIARDAAIYMLAFSDPTESFNRAVNDAQQITRKVGQEQRFLNGRPLHPGGFEDATDLLATCDLKQVRSLPDSHTFFDLVEALIIDFQGKNDASVPKAYFEVRYRIGVPFGQFDIFDKNVRQSFVYAPSNPPTNPPRVEVVLPAHTFKKIGEAL